MRKIYAAVLVFGVVASAHAQSITNVLFNPNPMHACELVQLTVIGTYPDPSYAPMTYKSCRGLGGVQLEGFRVGGPAWQGDQFDLAARLVCRQVTR